MERYIIAVRREARDKLPPDWPTALQQISGLTIVGAANPARIQVLASPEAIQRARQLLGDCCYFEPLVYHHAS